MQSIEQYGFKMLYNEDSKTYLETKRRIEDTCKAVEKAARGKNIHSLAHAVKLGGTRLYLSCYVNNDKVYFSIYDKINDKHIRTADEKYISNINVKRFEKLALRMQGAIQTYEADRELNVGILKNAWEDELGIVSSLDDLIAKYREELKNEQQNSNPSVPEQYDR